MHLKHDALAVANELFDLERAHHTLYALVLAHVNTAHSRQVVAVLLGYVSSQLSLPLRDLVEDVGGAAPHIVAKLGLYSPERAGGKVVRVAGEDGGHVEGRVRGRYAEPLEQINLAEGLQAVVEEELVHAGRHDQQVLLQQLVGED